MSSKYVMLSFVKVFRSKLTTSSTGIVIPNRWEEERAQFRLYRGLKGTTDAPSILHTSSIVYFKSLVFEVPLMWTCCEYSEYRQF